MSATTQAQLAQFLKMSPDTLISVGMLLQSLRELNAVSDEVGGDMVVTTLTASGAIEGASVTATGAVEGATVTATGAIEGASVTATGAVQGETVTATGAIEGDSITTTSGEITTLTGTTATYSALNGTTITTNVAEAHLALSGNTIQAAGTDPDIGVNIAGKGTGSIAFTTNGVDKWTVNASGGLNPDTDNDYDIGNEAVNPRDITASRSFVKKGIAAIGYGLLVHTSISAARTFGGGATETIPIQVPAGAKILGTSLRVDELIVLGGGGVSWSAAYSVGSTQSITTAQALAKNTKVDTMYDSNADSDILTAATDIVITPDAGTVDTGAMTAVTYYILPTSLNDAP